MPRLAALWLLVQVGGRLPVRVLYALAWLMGTGAWLIRRRVRRVTRDHMRHVLGPDASRRRIDREARRCAIASAEYYIDFARSAHIDPDQLFDEIEEIRGAQQIFEAYDEGRGLILASAHVGNPEIISHALGAFDLNLAVLTEPLRPPRLHAFVHRIRARTGACYLPANRQGLRNAYAHLRRGGTLGMLLDRDVLGTGVPFPFFGERARMPRGAVELAHRTGAAIVLGSVLRTGWGRYRIELDRVPLPPPTGDRERDLESGMRAVVAGVERLIRRDPGQWFALTPVWEGLPERRPSEAASNARPL